MKRASNFIAALILFGCASAGTAPAPSSPPLHVIGDLATYERQVRNDADHELVDLATLGILTDVRYATDANFMKKRLYPVARAVLRAPVARALAEINRELEPQGLAVKVFDGYRPYRVTVEMWEKIGDPDWVADPAKGSRHNRGAAVDLTLVSLRDGRELVMPTPYDAFTPQARHDFTDLPPDAIQNRATLRELMIRHGFEPIESEWWHYDFAGWKKYDLMDIPLEVLVGTP